VTHTAESWPIGAGLLQFPAVDAAGHRVIDGPVERWSAVFEEVADAGFDAVEVTSTWLAVGNLEPRRLPTLARAAESAGVSISAIAMARQSVLDPDEQVAQENIALTRRTIDAAAELGVGIVNTGLHRPLNEAQQNAEWFWLADWDGDPVDDRARWQLAVERLREIGLHAAQRGVRVSLELYEDSYLGTADGAVELVRAIDLPNVGLNPDLGNLVRLHRPVEPWESMLTKVLPVSNYWHVKNYLRDHDPATGAYFTAPAPLDSGAINYRRALRMALDAGFAGPICVEHYGGDGLSVSARNREYLRGLLHFHLRPRSPEPRPLDG
jgi:sugar phosphate isomerase/epimerase